MSETPLNPKQSLSAAMPFLDTLSLRPSSALNSAVRDSGLAPVESLVPGGLISGTFVHNKNGLTPAQAAGLQSVQPSLQLHNGGILSGAPSLPAVVEQPSFGVDEAPALGYMGADPVPEPLPVTANDQDILMPGLNASAPVTAFKHYGRVVGDDEKFKTGIALAKCNRGNILVLADVMRATDTEVSRLATSLDNLTVEVRLGTHDTRRSPSPSNTDSDDIQELF
ncbi:hypothetical protein K438DRAFT_1777939 [Mycena galopus ATCC 62051]|nr:hypothetical protein K438DRAFT_1777939 [Mycena galopus ATCC 62051]